MLKIGGSILYQDNQDINFDLMGKIKSWYVGNREQYVKVVMVTGGGAMSRNLQQRMKGNIANEKALHTIAMSVTQTSAELLAGFLGDHNIYIPKKIDAYQYMLEDGSRTIVSGGLKAGWSTDMDAAVFADILHEKRIYKVSNIDYIYDKDIKIYPHEPIKDMSWEDYFELFSITDNDTHQANSNIPIDKGCARFCRAKGISFFICGGKIFMKKNA